jgi:hypothetical protein
LKKFLVRAAKLTIGRLNIKVKPIDPAGLKLCWDFVEFLIILMYFLFLSITIGFDLTLTEIFEYVFGDSFGSFLELFSKIVLTTSLFVNLNTAYYDSGKLITNSTRIALRYLSKEALLDGLSLIPVYFTSKSSGLNIFIKAFFLFKIKEILKFFTNTETFLSSKIIARALFVLFTLCVKVFFLNHVLACLFKLIADSSTGDELSWLCSKKLLLEASWFSIYGSALNWALSTTLLSGESGITPQNEKEVWFSSLSMLIGTLMSGYVISSVIEIKKKWRQEDFELR